jgi:hypothetical protein
MLVALCEIRRLVEGDDDTALLDHRIGARERLAAHQLEHRIDWFNGLFKSFPCEVDDAVSAQPQQCVLLSGLRCRDDMCAGFVGNLDGQ